VQFEGELQVLRSGVVPHELENTLIAGLGHDRASAVLTEIEEMVQEQVNLGVWPDWMRTRYPIGPVMTPGLSVPRPSIKPPTSQQIEPDTDLRVYFDSGGLDNYLSDFRRDSSITFADIDRLMKLGPCVLAARLKQGPIMSALSGKRKWSLVSPNVRANKLRLVMEADLERLFLRNVHHILTSLEYGVALGSTIWQKKTAENIGVETGVGKSSEWWVVDKIEWAHPSTVPAILRGPDMSFAGFVHRRKNMDPRDVVIDPLQALVIPYMSRFGNLWGQTMFEQSYDFAYWYEVVMRAFLRFMERMATPVAVVYGPNRGRSVRPDGTTISNPQYGLLLAGAAAFSSAIYLPSERDIQTGQPLWSMEYLDTNQRGDQFVDALQYLGTQILRASLVGDRAFTQGSETGSYNAGEMHNKLMQIDNDFIFKAILGYLNDYLIRRYAMWNVDYNDPPMVRLRAEVIDPDEQEVLMKLFATAGNIKLFDGSPLDRVDWEEAFRSINVPVLEDEEFEALYEEHQERKKANQEMFQEVQSKAAQNNQPFGKNGGQQQQKQPQPQGQDKDKEARLSVLEHLVDGGMVPILLTPEQVRDIVLPGQESEDLDTVELQRRDRSPRGPRDPEFERQHPRDATGKFAKKEEEDDEEDEEGESLGDEPWPGADPERGIKGVVTIDDRSYVVVGDVTEGELRAFHDAHSRIYDRASELGYDLEPAEVVVVNSEDYESMAKYSGTDANTARAAAQSSGGFIATYDSEGRPIHDTKLISQPDRLEPIAFHEMLHTQPRNDASVGRGDISGYTEEVFTTLASMEYSERFGLPVYNGYPTQVSQMVEAANRNGWSKQRLYDYARLAHKTDGANYDGLMNYWTDRADVGDSQFPDALSSFSPGWESSWEALDDVYGFGLDWLWG
jgi:hypothetical protein